MEEGNKSAGSILLVDDNEKLRESIRKILEIDDYKVDEAENGKVAIEKVKSNNYDLVLMDIRMPEMDGIQAAKEIKKIKKDLFIVFITGEADKSEIEKALSLEVGHYAVLRKAYDLSVLPLRIKHLKEEAEEYKRIQDRSEIEKIKDFIKEEEEILKKDIEKEKGPALRLLIVIIISLMMGIIATWTLEEIPKIWNNILKLTATVEEMRKDLEKQKDLMEKYKQLKDYNR